MPLLGQDASLSQITFASTSDAGTHLAPGEVWKNRHKVSSKGHKRKTRRQRVSKTSTSASLAGKVAVVTGASAGIGRAIALTLAAEGVKVALGARRTDVLEELVKEIKVAGGQAIYVETDVVDREQVKNLVTKTEAAFGPVDILINNAAYYYFTMMKSLLEDNWERTIDVNCKGVMNGIGAVLGGMVERRSGHIVNISSVAGRKVAPGLAVYGGTKFFVEGMSQALRLEVATYGIKVTSIQPGFVDTEGIRGDFEQEAADKFNKIGKIQALKDTDVAQAVIYALSQPAHVSTDEVMMNPVQGLII